MQKQRFLKKIGLRIVELRLKKGWSQRDLAFECGKEPQSIERVENGKTNPTIFYLKEIADALGVKISTLLD
jgi:transcriptional regulator with XRE-family HTH domain